MTEIKSSKGIHISLWIAQGLLAAAFGMAGFMKLFSPVADLAKNGMSFVNHYEVGTVRIIGVVELLAAVGLILPSALRIFPRLTPLAAAGLTLVMALATQYHIKQNESAIASIVLGLLCLFVAWGRFSKSPITAKA